MQALISKEYFYIPFRELEKFKRELADVYESCSIDYVLTGHKQGNNLEVLVRMYLEV